MTSGIRTALVDVEAECVCGWSGDTLAREDYEDYTFTWWCPACGEDHTDNLDLERGSTRAAFAVFLTGVILAATGWFLPAPWLHFTVITGIFLALLIVYIAAVEYIATWLDGNERNQK